MPAPGFGSVVDQVRQTSQYSARTGSICRFIWHHQASTNDDATINMMVSGSRELSATYTVSNDNPGGRGWSRITGVCPEQYRPWTSDSQTADGRALTVEAANSSGGPDWGIADETFEACARLAAYAYQVYGVPLRRATSADPTGHLGHKEVVAIFGEGYATACPMNLDVDRIIARAAQLGGAGLTTQGSATPLSEEDDMTPEQDALLHRMASVLMLEPPTADATPMPSSVWNNQVAGAVQALTGGPQAMFAVVADIFASARAAAAASAATQGQVAALAVAVTQLAGGGQVDMAAIEAAAEKGAKDALSGIHFEITGGSAK